MLGIDFRALSVFAVVFFFTSCSEAPKAALKTESGTEKLSSPAGPVSGKAAFWEMYKSAHAWSADKVPISLESRTAPGEGKAAVWIATFGSPGKREARKFTYSVAAQPPDISKGITVGNALTWNGPTRDAMPFQTSEFSVDSDAAYRTALGQAQPWVKKHPDKQASLALGNTAQFDGPVWYVLWGDRKFGYAVYVSAKTGQIIK
jgi:hypothetical protein